MLFFYLVAELSHSEVLSAAGFLLKNACMIRNQMFVLLICFLLYLFVLIANKQTSSTGLTII